MNGGHPRGSGWLAHLKEVRLIALSLAGFCLGGTFYMWGVTSTVPSYQLSLWFLFPQHWGRSWVSSWSVSMAIRCQKCDDLPACAGSEWRRAADDLYGLASVHIEFSCGSHSHAGPAEQTVPAQLQAQERQLFALCMHLAAAFWCSEPPWPGLAYPYTSFAEICCRRDVHECYVCTMSPSCAWMITAALSVRAKDGHTHMFFSG